MARVLIVGCGCRGRELAGALVARGHAVRGTSRDRAMLEAVEAAGAEAVLADPDRLGTVTAQLDGVSVVCWLMGSARGEPEAVAALHGARLESLLEALVDTPVRGFVYEAAGDVDPEVLEHGANLVRRAAATYRMPVVLVETHRADDDEWLRATSEAVDTVLGG